MKIIDLGWCIARLEYDERNRLTIMSPSSVDEHYAPAESIVIYGKESLEKLRDALNEAYPIRA